MRLFVACIGACFGNSSNVQNVDAFSDVKGDGDGRIEIGNVDIGKDDAGSITAVDIQPPTEQDLCVTSQQPAACRASLAEKLTVAVDSSTAEPPGRVSLCSTKPSETLGLSFVGGVRPELFSMLPSGNSFHSPSAALSIVDSTPSLGSGTVALMSDPRVSLNGDRRGSDCGAVTVKLSTFEQLLSCITEPRWVGQGAQGAVLKAQWRSGCTVAVKWLVSDAVNVHAAYMEALLGKMLAHPYLVQTFDYAMCELEDSFGTAPPPPPPTTPRHQQQEQHQHTAAAAATALQTAPCQSLHRSCLPAPAPATSPSVPPAPKGVQEQQQEQQQQKQPQGQQQEQSPSRDVDTPRAQPGAQAEAPGPPPGPEAFATGTSPDPAATSAGLADAAAPGAAAAMREETGAASVATSSGGPQLNHGPRCASASASATPSPNCSAGVSVLSVAAAVPRIRKGTGTGMGGSMPVPGRSRAGGPASAASAFGTASTRSGVPTGASGMASPFSPNMAGALRAAGTASACASLMCLAAGAGAGAGSSMGYGGAPPEAPLTPSFHEAPVPQSALEGVLASGDSFDGDAAGGGSCVQPVDCLDVLKQLGAAPGKYVVQIVSEWCDEGTLHAAIRKGVFRPQGRRSRTWALRALLRTAREVALGMCHLHSLNIIHGDLKPGNVLLKSSRVDSRGFVAKVADFGLSRLCGKHEDFVPTADWGTVPYMAGEYLDNKLCKSSDVYSFGVLLWQMYTGKAPFAGHLEAQVAVGVMMGSLQLEWPANMPAPLLRLGQSCCRHEPEQRPTFKEVVVALAGIETQVRDAYTRAKMIRRCDSGAVAGILHRPHLGGPSLPALLPGGPSAGGAPPHDSLVAAAILAGGYRSANLSMGAGAPNTTQGYGQPRLLDPTGAHYGMASALTVSQSVLLPRSTTNTIMPAGARCPRSGDLTTFVSDAATGPQQQQQQQQQWAGGVPSGASGGVPSGASGGVPPLPSSDLHVSTGQESFIIGGSGAAHGGAPAAAPMPVLVPLSAQGAGLQRAPLAATSPSRLQIRTSMADIVPFGSSLNDSSPASGAGIDAGSGIAAAAGSGGGGGGVTPVSATGRRPITSVTPLHFLAAQGLPAFGGGAGAPADGMQGRVSISISQQLSMDTSPSAADAMGATESPRALPYCPNHSAFATAAAVAAARGAFLQADAAVAAAAAAAATAAAAGVGWPPLYLADGSIYGPHLGQRASSSFPFTSETETSALPVSETPGALAGRATAASRETSGRVPAQVLSEPRGPVGAQLLLLPDATTSGQQPPPLPALRQMPQHAVAVASGPAGAGAGAGSGPGGALWIGSGPGLGTRGSGGGGSVVLSSQPSSPFPSSPAVPDAAMGPPHFAFAPQPSPPLHPHQHPHAHTHHHAYQYAYHHHQQQQQQPPQSQSPQFWYALQLPYVRQYQHLNQQQQLLMFGAPGISPRASAGSPAAAVLGAGLSPDCRLVAAPGASSQLTESLQVSPVAQPPRLGSLTNVALSAPSSLRNPRSAPVSTMLQPAQLSLPPFPHAAGAAAKGPMVQLQEPASPLAGPYGAALSPDLQLCGSMPSGLLTEHSFFGSGAGAAAGGGCGGWPTVWYPGLVGNSAALQHQPVPMPGQVHQAHPQAGGAEAWPAGLSPGVADAAAAGGAEAPVRGQAQAQGQGQVLSAAIVGNDAVLQGLSTNPHDGAVAASPGGGTRATAGSNGEAAGGALAAGGAGIASGSCSCCCGRGELHLAASSAHSASQVSLSMSRARLLDEPSGDPLVGSTPTAAASMDAAATAALATAAAAAAAAPPLGIVSAAAASSLVGHMGRRPRSARVGGVMMLPMAGASTAGGSGFVSGGLGAAGRRSGAGGGHLLAGHGLLPTHGDPRDGFCSMMVIPLAPLQEDVVEGPSSTADG